MLPVHHRGAGQGLSPGRDRGLHRDPHASDPGRRLRAPTRHDFAPCASRSGMGIRESVSPVDLPRRRWPSLGIAGERLFCISLDIHRGNRRSPRSQYAAREPVRCRRPVSAAGAGLARGGARDTIPSTEGVSRPSWWGRARKSGPGQLRAKRQCICPPLPSLVLQLPFLCRTRSSAIVNDRLMGDVAR